MSTDQIDQAAAPDGLTIAPLPDFSADVLRTARLLGVDQYLPAVAEFTRDIFGGFADVAVVPDPEVPDDVHIIFEVPVTGSAGKLSQQQGLWCQRLLATVPRAPRIFSITMNYQE